MEEKGTVDLLKELESNSDLREYLKNNEETFVNVELSNFLDKLLKEKNLKKSEVVKKSELSEVFAYQIFSGTRCATKYKLVAIAVAMGLNFEETQRLLTIAKEPILYPKIRKDSIIIFGINNKKSVMEINEMLYFNDCDTL